MSKQLPSTIGRFKIVQCPYCGYLQITEALVALKCQKCNRQKSFISSTKDSTKLAVKLLAHTDNAEEARITLQMLKGTGKNASFQTADSLLKKKK